MSDPYANAPSSTEPGTFSAQAVPPAVDPRAPLGVATGTTNIKDTATDAAPTITIPAEDHVEIRALLDLMEGRAHTLQEERIVEAKKILAVGEGEFEGHIQRLRKLLKADGT